jgi:two-component system nitrate/nitrite response regulator NarL
MKKIRTLLADDHRLFREGLINILENQPAFEVVGEAGDGLEAIVKARKLQPDLILMDIAMPVCDGLEATKTIKQEMPDVIIVMLTVRDEDEKLFEAIRNGAQGYLLKSITSREMLTLLRGAVRGEAAITPALGGRMLEEFRRVSQLKAGLAEDNTVSLTAREREVLCLVSEGASNKEISQKLNLSIHTVKSHMRKILAKLHMEKRQEAASYAKREGLIPPSLDV